MNRADELHKQAMALVDEALAQKAQGRSVRADESMRKAFDLEKRAAERVQLLGIEPSRSILFRSAASLALECREFEQARELAFRGLDGDVPFEIEVELRQILDDLPRIEEIRSARRLLFESCYPNIVSFFCRNGFSRERARQLARFTFQRYARERLVPAGPPDRQHVLALAARELELARRLSVDLTTDKEAPNGAEWS